MLGMRYASFFVISLSRLLLSTSSHVGGSCLIFLTGSLASRKLARAIGVPACRRALN